jgi:hypothetical protein
MIHVILEASSAKKLLEQVRNALRVKHYTHRTEQFYLDLICRYILFHNQREDMAELGMEAPLEI